MEYRRHLVAMGMVVGASDYLVLHKNGWAAIEFKRDDKAKRNGLTERQKAFKEQCEQLEIPYLLTCDPHEAVEFIKSLL